MILSNTSEKVELSRKAITTLGDSLYNRGDLFGAQFCYLVADISFGKWSNVNQETMMISNSSSAIRLVLLGSSQHKCFREFATNEAIVMTEIYEYARTLNEEKFTILDFQVGVSL
jgi:COPII coat assembly protein SEC16